MIELYLVWKPKIVSWIILSPILEPIKGVYIRSTSKAKSSQATCLPSVSPSHFKQIPKDHNQSSSLPSASPSHFIIIKVQAYQVLSILNGPRRSKQPNFVSLFHVSMFFLNSKNPCSIWCTLFMYICIYIFKKKKKIKISKSFPKKREKFSKKKKKKVFGLGELSP